MIVPRPSYAAPSPADRAGRCSITLLSADDPTRIKRAIGGAQYFGSLTARCDEARPGRWGFRLVLSSEAVVESSNAAAGPNPPVPHRKEAFLRSDDPRRAKFERLTGQEERAGLLDETASIGTRAGWNDRLRERGYELRGQRLVRCRQRMD
jgi:hypothetical protein